MQIEEASRRLNEIVAEVRTQHGKAAAIRLVEQALQLARVAPVDFSDRKEAERVAWELDRLHMPLAVFHALHHRDTLRQSDTVAVHAKWLSKDTARLGTDHERLAQRMWACLTYRLCGHEWESAAAEALRNVPR